MSRHARIELRPADLGWFDRGGELAALKPSARPHYLRLVAANGQVLATSETYSTCANARRAAKGLRFFMYDVLALDDPDLPLWVEFDADGNQR